MPKLNKKRGRPSKVDNYEKKKKIISLMYQRGFIDEEVAQVLDVTRRTIENWKKKDKEFFHTLTQGKAVSDNKVEVALFERAVGYNHEDVDIRVVDHQIVKTPLTKYYPPDTTACIFWLKNRKPEEWKDKSEHEHTGKDGGPIQHKLTDLSDEQLLAIIQGSGSDGAPKKAQGKNKPS
jgi:transcriptional regulator with XRE-family HTH domain